MKQEGLSIEGQPSTCQQVGSGGPQVKMSGGPQVSMRLGGGDKCHVVGKAGGPM